MAPPPSPPDSPLAGRSLFVVEDNAAFSSALVLSLESVGCRVVGPFVTAAEALEALDGAQPDAAVLDVGLADRDSGSIARRLEADGVPFLFLTGYGDEAQLPRRHPSAPCLAKPVELKVLRETLAGFLSR